MLLFECKFQSRKEQRQCKDNVTAKHEKINNLSMHL